MNKILLLKPTDQSHHWLNSFLNMKCSYDLTNWEVGFKNIKEIDVHTVNFMEYFVEFGFDALQKYLIELIKQNSFNYIILPTMYYEISLDTFKKISMLGTKVIVCFFDDTFRFKNYNIFYCQIADYIITHETKKSIINYKNNGYLAHFFPNYPSYHFYYNHNSYTLNYNVSFVGSNIADRENYYNELLNSSIQTDFFGKNWNNGLINSNKMINIFRNSKINLNFTKTIDNSGNNQLKGRIFEICMSGGFLLTEYYDEIEEYFKIGEEIDIFRSKEELIKKVNFYLSNDKKRETLRLAAHEKVKKLYNFETEWFNYFKNIENFKNEKAMILNPSLEHKINFFNWNIAFLKAYDSINDKISKQEYISNLEKSGYFNHLPLSELLLPINNELIQSLRKEIK